MPAEGLGRKIASYRQRRGLSQRELAALVGRSEAWLSQVERGVRPVKNLEVLESLASVLGVSLGELAPNAPAVAAEDIPAEAIPLRLLLSANYALRAAIRHNGVATADLSRLRADVTKAWKMAHDAQYSNLIPLLETLLPLLESSALADTAAAQEVFGLMAKCYHACSAALAKLGQYDAAWVAADRAIFNAGRAGDPLLMAEGAFRLAIIFQNAHQYDQARHTATTAVAALQGMVEREVPQALSLFGALHLQLAVIAATQDAADTAHDHLAAARGAAEKLAVDRNDYETEFGPTNVALHEVAVAVALGDAGEAVRLGSSIDTSGLSLERQGRLLIDMARAWTQRRNVREAVATLERAEALTPEQVHSHRHVKTMINDLRLMEPTPYEPLAALARRVSED